MSIPRSFTPRPLFSVRYFTPFEYAARLVLEAGLLAVVLTGLTAWPWLWHQPQWYWVTAYVLPSVSSALSVVTWRVRRAA